MDQQKIGEFLKELRKEKGLTQEELAEKFYTSSRTVSRWETGKNMPELTILIELADFYDVDIRELIDGERKSENMDKETKDTLLKVAEYTETEKRNVKKTLAKWYVLLTISPGIMLIGTCNFISSGILYGVIPENICNFLFWLSYEISMILLTLSLNRTLAVYIKNQYNKKIRIIVNGLSIIFMVMVTLGGLFDTKYGLFKNVLSKETFTVIMCITTPLTCVFCALYGIFSAKAEKKYYEKEKEKEKEKNKKVIK